MDEISPLLSLGMQIIEILSGLLTPAIAIVTVIILYCQYRLEKQRWKLALYDKRFAVYLTVKKYLAEIMSAGTTTFKEAMELMRNTKESEFLFSAEIKQFIEQIYKKGLDLERINAVLAKESDQGKIEKLVEQKRQVFDWLEEQFKTTVIDIFSKYLKIAEY